LLKDEKGILFRQTENTQSSRQIRFTAVDEVNGMASTIRAYLLERRGREIRDEGTKKTTEEYPVPDEFGRKCEEIPRCGKPSSR
jgi:uncharacterized protein YdeI (YjbR/CyaY-like superfamily)